MRIRMSRKTVRFPWGEPSAGPLWGPCKSQSGRGPFRACPAKRERPAYGGAYAVQDGMPAVRAMALWTTRGRESAIGASAQGDLCGVRRTLGNPELGGAVHLVEDQGGRSEPPRESERSAFRRTVARRSGLRTQRRKAPAPACRVGANGLPDCGPGVPSRGTRSRTDETARAENAGQENRAMSDRDMLIDVMEELRQELTAGKYIEGACLAARTLEALQVVIAGMDQQQRSLEAVRRALARIEFLTRGIAGARIPV
jgi:hypothetical protein